VRHSERANEKAEGTEKGIFKTSTDKAPETDVDNRRPLFRLKIILEITHVGNKGVVPNSPCTETNKGANHEKTTDFSKKEKKVLQKTFADSLPETHIDSHRRCKFRGGASWLYTILNTFRKNVKNKVLS